MKILAILVAALGILSGCATIVDGSTQTVTIQSEPSGAEVSINGSIIGTTPVSIDIDRAEGTQLSVHKDGYETVIMSMPTEMNGMFWGNILIGGLLGSTTDSASGASVEYVPGVHMINLHKNS